jgi:hypothetical protein
VVVWLCGLREEREGGSANEKHKSHVGGSEGWKKLKVHPRAHMLWYINSKYSNTTSQVESYLPREKKKAPLDQPTKRSPMITNKKTHKYPHIPPPVSPTPIPNNPTTESNPSNAHHHHPQASTPNPTKPNRSRHSYSKPQTKSRPPIERNENDDATTSRG